MKIDINVFVSGVNHDDCGKLFVYIFQLTYTTLWFVFGLNIKLIIDVRNSLLFIVIQIVASEY